MKAAGDRFKANNRRQICTERGVALGTLCHRTLRLLHIYMAPESRRNEKKTPKNTPQETLHAEMPPAGGEGGEVGGFSGIGCCVPALSHPPLGQSPLLPGFKAG